jgi:hypothetical protein
MVAWEATALPLGDTRVGQLCADYSHAGRRCQDGGFLLLAPMRIAEVKSKTGRWIQSPMRSALQRMLRTVHIRNGPLSVGG